MRLIFSFTLLFMTLMLHSQGKIMLVGGGGEGNWSDPAYSWAIKQSANKKVAIISYNEESQALPDYFLELGASEAINVQIDTREQSEHDSTYTYLMAFDCFFFKGGDQSNYYRVYKNSKVTDAITAKYLEGGVISGTSAGMAILSGIIYSADRASVFPDQVLNNFQDNDITLHSDFVNLLPGYIADTHFIERGRSFRLIGFIARWFHDTNEVINGIGVDDQTAFCIDEELVGTAIGTGAVSLFFPQGINIKENNFYFDSLASVQLIDSNKYDLVNHQLLEAGKIDSSPLTNEETGNFTLFLSGSQSLANNIEMLQEFRNSNGLNDSTLIVTNDKNAIGQLLLQLQEIPFKVVETSSENNHQDSTALRNWIRNSAKVLFYLNDIDALFEFIHGGATGELLQSHIKRNDLILAFIGDDASLAGQSVVTNNIDDVSASYRNRLKFTDGLGVLNQSFIVSNAIDRSTTDYYENNTSAVLYQLLDQKLKYGFYINAGSYLKISTDENELIVYQVGDYPTVVVTNESKVGGKAEDRNVIGIDLINYHILLDGQNMSIGSKNVANQTPYEYEPVVLALSSGNIEREIFFYPNPVKEQINTSAEWIKNYQIFDVQGKVLKKGKFGTQINVQELKSGNYFIQLINDERTETLRFQKIK
ncbi:MAG: T9SS type A sorting domain-containing protein [Cyclobacteriaceae bacterium]